MLVIFASSVRARHSSSSKVERNFAYSNFLLVELLFSPVFFAFVSKFLRGCSPPSYHIQSTWTSGVYCREQGISETLQYTVKLKHTFWSMNISKRLGNFINTLPILGWICHLLACASKQSWNASIAVAVAFLLHEVHLDMMIINTNHRLKQMMMMIPMPCVLHSWLYDRRVLVEVEVLEPVAELDPGWNYHFFLFF